ncbi:MAG: DEAD/DEAH box helicase [Planctomycetes bacterium]|nr:DEAD/DEAH box helicase [Planctomycetota bacterium]
MPLPILELESALVAHLAVGNRLALSAPTGSGKTTQVPQFLLRCAGVRGQILVSQPRRLAARMLARRVASEVGTPLGGLVGYQTRHECLVGPRTRIRFLTEGLLLRLLRDPDETARLGAVVLDEFHERGLAADASLAAVKRLQEAGRPDLRLVVMSATLETDRVAAYLGCPALRTGQREWPVETSYLATPPRGEEPWELAAEALREILARGAPGDVLVFMPGEYEIRRTLEACRQVAARAASPCVLLPLHGRMPPDEQDAVLEPRRERRVLVSTNVAQTSITVEGVRHVVDAGLARVLRFDPRRGVNSLRVEPISRAAADQRAGRAGRTAPGTCRRLWTEREHRTRPAHDVPEVRRLDLAEILLWLKDSGVERAGEFPWLEPPEPERVAQAARLLEVLGATDRDGRLTATGRRMAAVPAHPRLSRLLLEAAARGVLGRACLWAALVSERELLLDRRRAREFARGGEEGRVSDFLALEAAFEAARASDFRPGACRELGLHAAAAREVGETSRLYLRSCRDAGLAPGPRAGGPLGEAAEVEALLLALLSAYPDHLATRRGEGARGYVLSEGRAAVLDASSVAGGHPLLLAVEVQDLGSGKSRNTTLGLASAIEPVSVVELFPERVATEQETFWNDEAESVERVERLLLDGLELERTARPEPDADRAAAILADRIRSGRIHLERWDEEVEQWIARTRCVRGWFPERPLCAYGEEDLRALALSLCAGATRASQVRARPCLQAVEGALSGEDRRFVEEMAPRKLDLPSGRRLRIAYAPGSPPRARARIQELFGLARTPRVARGRQAVLLEILAPNQRPVQLTDDLEGFWSRLYPTLKRELQRRYPKHEWR